MDLAQGFAIFAFAWLCGFIVGANIWRKLAERNLQLAKDAKKLYDELLKSYEELLKSKKIEGTLQ